MRPFPISDEKLWRKRGNEYLKHLQRGKKDPKVDVQLGGGRAGSTDRTSLSMDVDVSASETS